MNLFTRPWSDSGCLQDPTGNQVATLSCIWPLFSNVINAALALSGTIAVIYIILAGIRIITANGNAEQVSGAKKTLTFAIIGFVFILLSMVIFNLVFTITGVDQNSVGTNPDGGINLTQPQ